MGLTVEEDLLLHDYMERWRVALVEDWWRVVDQDREMNKIILDEPNRMVQAVQQNILYVKNEDLNTKYMSIWTACFMRNMGLLLPRLAGLGQSFVEHTVKNSMNTVFMMLDVMALYKKDSRVGSLLDQYEGINIFSRACQTWAAANAPEFATALTRFSLDHTAASLSSLPSTRSDMTSRQCMMHQIAFVEF